MAVPATPTADPTTDKPPRPRRWIPLSLKMFVAILLLAGVGSPLWIGVRLWRQDVAIRELKHADWLVHTEPMGPTWFRKHLSGDISKYLCSVNWLSAPGGSSAADARWIRFNEAGLSIFDGRLNGHLRQQVSDSDLAHFGRLIGLADVDANCTTVSDDGLANLKGMSNLGALFLRDTPVTDAGLVHLAGLPKLDYISLDNTHVTDEGLSHLRGLAGLKLLSLENTRVTAAGVAELKRVLPNLIVNR
jgi:hypothetical protein